jgi:hypothetical protein
MRKELSYVFNISVCKTGAKANHLFTLCCHDFWLNCNVLLCSKTPRERYGIYEQLYPPAMSVLGTAGARLDIFRNPVATVLE